MSRDKATRRELDRLAALEADYSAARYTSPAHAELRDHARRQRLALEALAEAKATPTNAPTLFDC